MYSFYFQKLDIFLLVGIRIYFIAGLKRKYYLKSVGVKITVEKIGLHSKSICRKSKVHYHGYIVGG